MIQHFNWNECAINFKNFIDFECKFCPNIECKKTSIQKRECYWAFLELEIEELMKEGE